MHFWELGHLGFSRAYLVDASGSMGGTAGVADLEAPKIELVKTELKQLLGESSHFAMDDRVALIVFKNRKGKPLVKTVLPFQYARTIDENYAHLISDISTINAEGGTPISAGIKEALSLTTSEHGEREILLITDADYSLGEDPRIHLYDALMQHATINVIYLGISERLDMLEELARKTGGSLRQVRRPGDLHRYLFYPPDPPPLDPATEELVSMASSKIKEYDSAVSGSAKGEGGAGAAPPPGLANELKGIRTKISKRYDDLGKELAVLTLDRQEPLIKLTGIRQMLERRRISKKEYLKRASETEELLGNLVRAAKSKKHAIRVLESIIADLDSRILNAKK
jgi:hypothetical protein